MYVCIDRYTYICIYIYRCYLHPSSRQLRLRGSQPYLLNTRGGRSKYGILFIVSLFYEYSNLEYVHIHAIYRVNQAEYVIRILVATPQEYVNTYSTCRVAALLKGEGGDGVS